MKNGHGHAHQCIHNAWLPALLFVKDCIQWISSEIKQETGSVTWERWPITPGTTNTLSAYLGNLKTGNSMKTFTIECFSLTSQMVYFRGYPLPTNVQHLKYILWNQKQVLPSCKESISYYSIRLVLNASVYTSIVHYIKFMHLPFMWYSPGHPHGFHMYCRILIVNIKLNISYTYPSKQ